VADNRLEWLVIEKKEKVFESVKIPSVLQNFVKNLYCFQYGFSNAE